MKNLFLLFLLLTTTASFAQQRRILHQTFELEGVKDLDFKIYDKYTVELWAGAALLVETTVEMWEDTREGRTDAQDAIFKHFVEKGRYQIVGTLEKGVLLRFQSKDMQRAAIRTSKGYCTEKVLVRFMLPENFQKTGDHTWALGQNE